MNGKATQDAQIGCPRNHGLTKISHGSERWYHIFSKLRRKLHIWDSKRCASQFCHSKHRLRKNRTPNIRHLIILSFEVFSLFSFFFSGIWQGERTLLPLAWTSHLECTAHASYCLSPIVTSSPRPTPPSSFRRLLPLLHDPPCPVLAAAALGAPTLSPWLLRPGSPRASTAWRRRLVCPRLPGRGRQRPRTRSDLDPNQVHAGHASVVNSQL